MQIKEILKMNEGEKIDGIFLVENIKLISFKQKEGEYISFTLRDKTGTVECKVWNNAHDVFKKIKEDDVINITGAANIYNDKVSVIASLISLEDKYDIHDFIATSEFNPKKMYKELCEIMDTIEDKDIKKIWEEYRTDEKFMEKFKLFPGGKGGVHHTYLHGLLEHTLRILRLVSIFSSVYNVNKDRLLLGTFLHDTGKIYAYKITKKIEMSNLGRLHEHTALGYYLFMNKISELDDEIKYEKKKELVEDIGHMILSHHDNIEWHSFIKPLTKEAKILAIADHIDSFENNFNNLFKDSDEQWIFDRLNKQFCFNRSRGEK